MKSKLRPIMLGGTGSDVGKSILAAGLCRIFKQDGYNPAPFKAQNMALNSFVTPDGFELGRAQAVQAEAACVECMSEMNPILLKPTGDCTSQVVLNGVPIGNSHASDYFKKEGREYFRQAAHKAFDTLSRSFNPIVMEGAGSIAEINLRDIDLVNMSMAEYADAAVILVADIDRGGVFASAFGSIILQKTRHREMIKGIIINKFRGDEALFSDGRKMLEDICGVPVVGVMPYLRGIHIEDEDSLALKNRLISHSTDKVNIAVVELPHISNFTDFAPLECNPSVNLFYTLDPTAIRESHIIILPGSKATISDLAFIKDKAVDKAIIDAYHSGKYVIGICGGYQMMGLTVSDPNEEEGNIKEIRGLGLLPTHTTISHAKKTMRREFKFLDNDCVCKGYEIHMGKTESDALHPVAILSDGTSDGYFVDGKCFGTYLHGLFDNKCVVDYILKDYPHSTLDFDYARFKDSQYDTLAEEMRKHLNIDLIYKIMAL